MNYVYYTPFFSTTRDMLVKKCMDVLNKGQKAVYILPSREAMFDVREKFISLYGGIADTHIFGFDDFERLLCGGRINRPSVIHEDTIYYIIKDIIGNFDDDTLYDSVKDKPGFVRAVYRSIKRLKRLDLTPIEYAEKISSLDGALKEKCSIISEVYSKYEAYIKENSIYDVDDISKQACHEACSSEPLSDVGIIIIDGFINIDPVNKNLIKNIASHYSDIDIAASVPFKNENNEEFIMSEILKDLEELGFAAAGMGEDGVMQVNPSIKLLADSIYSGSKAFDKEASGISISSSPCIEHEVRCAARIIKKRLVDNVTAPDRVGIFIKDVDEYRETIKDIFSEMGIPVSIAGGDKLITVPLVKDVLSILAYHLDGRDEDGFKNIVSSKYMLPDGVLESLGYDTKRLLKIAGQAVKKSERENYGEIMCSLVSKEPGLECIKECIRDYTDTTYAFGCFSYDSLYECIKAYRELLSRIDIRENIISLYREKVIDGESFVRDLKAVERIENVLDSMMELSNSLSIVPEGEYIEGLYRGLVESFSNIDIRISRPEPGGVKVLNPDLARGQVYDIVFLLGVNEGIFPKITNRNPLFDTNEDDVLFREGINNINQRWELEREKIRFNMCIGSALKELYISYRTSAEDGGYMIKSPFIDEVASLFKEDALHRVIGEKVYMRDRFHLESKASSMREGIRNITGSIWSGKTDNLDSMEYIGMLYGDEDTRRSIDYINHGAKVEFVRMENPVFDMYDGILSDPSLAQSDANYGFSASQINSFVSCPFLYFTERVLGLSELEEDEALSARSLGSFYHEVLKEYYTDNDGYDTFDEDRLRGIFDGKIDSLDDGSCPKTLFEYVSCELYSTLRDFLIHDEGAFQHYEEKTGCRIKPVLLEHPFKIGDCMGKSVVKGIADRVDLEINKDGNYTGRYIIYDYKKSSIKSLKDCVEGMDFQLPVYYMAINQYLKDYLDIEEPDCLGLIYYSIQSHERKGIIRKDVKPYLFEGRKGPRDLVSPGNLWILMEWVSEYGGEVIENIRRGRFSLPYDCSNENTPWGCMFKPICRHDRYRVSGKKGDA